MPEVYKSAMVRMFLKELTNLRMYGFKRKLRRNAQGNTKFRKYGKVKIHSMKYHTVLQALSSLQAQSRNLKLNVQIGLSEQGKVSNVSKPTKNNKRLNRH